MKSFWNFFTGTFGVILAIILCNLILLVGCLVIAIAGPIVFPITPTP